MKNKLIDIPKVELHVHLDCSLSYNFVKEFVSGISEVEFDRKFTIQKRCSDLSEYLTYAQSEIQLLQTERQLRLSVIDIAKQFIEENVLYAEVRFCPILHTSKGLSSEDVTRIVLQEVAKVNSEGQTYINIVLSILREQSTAIGRSIVDLAYKYRDQNVVGIDLASDESQFGIENHIENYKYAEQLGIHRTAHVGEGKGAGAVREAIHELNPDRIGHGVRSIEDQEVVKLIKQKGIHLEVCPSGNLRTNLYRSFKEHPVDQFYREGVGLSINTDGRTILGLSLSHEYDELVKNFNWTEKDFLGMNLHAIEDSFASDKIKRRIKSKLNG